MTEADPAARILAELPGRGRIEVVAEHLLLCNLTGRAAVLGRDAAALARRLDHDMTTAWQSLRVMLVYGDDVAIVPADARLLLISYEAAAARLAGAARAGLDALAVSPDAREVSRRFLAAGREPSTAARPDRTSW